MRSVNLHEDTIKILVIHFSYNKQLENDENFKKHIAKNENVLKLWRTRNLSLEEKIRVFKSLVLSEIPHLAPVKTIRGTFQGTFSSDSVVQEIILVHSLKKRNRVNG